MFLFLLSSGIYFAIAIILHIISSVLFSRITPKLAANKRVWDDTFFAALKLPFYLTIWGMASLLTFEAAAPVLGITHGLQLLTLVRPVGGVVLLGWFLFRYVGKIENKLSSGEFKTRMDPTSVRALSMVLRLTAILPSFLVVLQILGIPVSGVLAFGGASGIVVGLAAKDLLANFFGGFMILMDRPFRVGDWIRSPDKEIEGYVEHIGWRLTRIRTFEKRPLYVPNALFSNVSVENPSRMTNRRIKTFIGVRYEDASKIGAIVTEVEEMLNNHSGIDHRHLTMVNLAEFGPSSLNFIVYTFTKAIRFADFYPVRQEIYLKIIEIIESHGAQCAFPTSTVHIPEGMEFHTRANPLPVTAEIPLN